MSIISKFKIFLLNDILHSRDENLQSIPNEFHKKVNYDWYKSVQKKKTLGAKC